MYLILKTTVTFRGKRYTEGSIVCSGSAIGHQWVDRGLAIEYVGPKAENGEPSDPRWAIPVGRSEAASARGSAPRVGRPDDAAEPVFAQEDASVDGPDYEEDGEA